MAGLASDPELGNVGVHLAHPADPGTAGANNGMRVLNLTQNPVNPVEIGIYIYDGDPGLGILLVPLGAVLLLLAVLLTARSIRG